MDEWESLDTFLAFSQHLVMHLESKFLLQLPLFDKLGFLFAYLPLNARRTPY